MTRDVVLITEKTKTTQNCAIRTFIEKKAKCSLRKLENIFDNWLATPIHNVFAFYSTLPKYLSCGEVRDRIQEESGVIEIKPGCAIITPTTTIHASMDKTSIRRYFYTVESTDAEIEGEKEKNHTKIYKPTASVAINDEALDEVINEERIAVIRQKG